MAFTQYGSNAFETSREALKRLVEHDERFLQMTGKFPVIKITYPEGELKFALPPGENFSFGDLDQLRKLAGLGVRVPKKVYLPIPVPGLHVGGFQIVQSEGGKYVVCVQRNPHIDGEFCWLYREPPEDYYSYNDKPLLNPHLEVLGENPVNLALVGESKAGNASTVVVEIVPSTNTSDAMHPPGVVSEI